MPCRIFHWRAHAPRLRRATSRSCARSTMASWPSTRCATATGRSTPTPSSATARRRPPRPCLSAAWRRSAVRLTCGGTTPRAARPPARPPTKCAGARAALACCAQSVSALDRPPHLEPAFALVKRHALCSARTPAPSLPHCAGEHVSHFLSAANSSAACFPGVPRVARPQVPWALTRAGAPAAHGSLCSTASPALARRAHGKAPSLPASPESELPARPGPTSLSAAARAAGSLSAAWRCAAPTSWRTRCGPRR